MKSISLFFSQVHDYIMLILKCISLTI